MKNVLIDNSPNETIITNIFGTEAITRKYIGNYCYEKKYCIVNSNNLYICYVKKRKFKGKWSKSILLQKSNKILFFKYINNEGLKIFEL